MSTITTTTKPHMYKVKSLSLYYAFHSSSEVTLLMLWSISFGNFCAHVYVFYFLKTVNCSAIKIFNNTWSSYDHFTEYLLCTKIRDLYFILAVKLTNLLRQLFPTFYRWENWSTKRYKKTWPKFLSRQWSWDFNPGFAWPPKPKTLNNHHGRSREYT